MKKKFESSPKKIIYSKHIFPNDNSDPINGYIFIEDGQFIDIKSMDILPSNFLESYPDFEFFDYENQYIFPGIIDVNVHLNSTYDVEWEDIEGITKMAIKGGITTIMDNPILANSLNKDHDNDLTQIQSHYSHLEENLYTDCGIFCFIGPNNFQNIDVLSQTGVFGFKGFLSPCIDSKMPYFSKKDLKDLKNYLHEFPSNNLFIFHDEMANQRDLYLCSPCRSVEKANRIDLSYKIGETSDFGGGFHGDVAETYDSGEEEEKDGVLDLQVSKLNNIQYNIGSPTTAILKIDAEIFSKLEQEKFVAVMEESQYDEMKEDEKIEEKWVENDSELEASEKISEDFPEDEIDKGKKVSCPTFNHRTSLNDSIEPFKFSIKKLTLTTLEIAEHDVSSEKEVVSSKEVRNESEEIISPDKLKANSRSPTKRQSGLMLRRKKNFRSTQIDEENNSNLNNIVTYFKQKNEDEEKKTHSYFFSILSNHPISYENDGVTFIYKAFQNNIHSRVLISNLSTAKMAYFIREEKKIHPNLKIFTDISIPYLFFCSDMIQKGQTKFKNSPPIREKQDMMNSIQSLKLGVFDVVSSYHLQVPPNFKNIDHGNFRRAFSGNSCVGYNLQAIWTRFLSILKGKCGKKYFSNQKMIENLFKTLIRVLAVNPAKLLEISNKKGEIKRGNDADFLVWDPFVVKKVKKEKIYLKYPRIHLFRGFKLYGNVNATFLRGDLVYYKENNEEIFVKKGEVLRREFLIN